MLDLPCWFSLNRRVLERQFALPAVELTEIIALDRIDLLPEQSSLRIRSHDLHGPLPEITLGVDVGDRLETFDLPSREAAKLCAMARIRQELAEALPGLWILLIRTLRVPFLESGKGLLVPGILVSQLLEPILELSRADLFSSVRRNEPLIGRLPEGEVL